MLLKLVPLLVVFGIVLFCWVFLFPYLNRRIMSRSAEKLLKNRRSSKGGEKSGTSNEKIAMRLMLSNRIERAITLSILILLGIFAVLYLLRILSRA